jgi:hypothetical protein
MKIKLYLSFIFLVLVSISACGNEVANNQDMAVFVDVGDSAADEQMVDMPEDEDIADSVADGQIDEEPSRDEGETPTVPPAEKVLIIDITCSSDQCTKLEALAYLNDIEVEVNFSNYGSSLQDQASSLLRRDDYIGLLISWSLVNSENVYAIDSLVQRGGRVIFMYDADIFTSKRGYSDTLSNVFDVVFASEEVYGGESDFYKYTNNMLPSWLRRYEIGGSCLKGKSSIEGYLMSKSRGYEEGFLTSQATNKKRMVYMSRANDSVIFMPLQCHETHPTVFYHDRYIDSFDNEEATVEILKFLRGQN